MSIITLLEKKKRIISEHQRKVKDEHSFRSPIKCGLTVHPGYGCSLSCLYCYIYEMGLSSPRPSSLTGEELKVALASNPYFLPSATFLAIGSITDPFLPEISKKTVEFSHAISHLGNPAQISTKIPSKDAEKVLEEIPKISFLVSVSTSSGILEKGAPPPKERINFASSLGEMGYNSFIFIRPIIPGYTERDEKLFDMISKAEIRGVVLGGMRVNRGIMLRISSEIDVKEILKRIGNKRLGKKQISIEIRDLKEQIGKKLSELGITCLPMACAATALSYSLGCLLCKQRCKGKMEKVDKEEIRRFLQLLGKEAEVSLRGEDIIIKGKIGKGEKEMIKAYYRRRIIVSSEN